MVGREDERRVRIHTRPLGTARRDLLSSGEQFGKVEKRHARPSKFAVEILARAPVFTSETSKQCRASSDCPEFLSEQAAVPNITRKLLHTH